MEGLNCLFVGVRVDCAIGEVWGEGGKETGLESVFDVSWSGGGGGYCMGWVGGDKGSGEELGGEKG